MQFSISIKGTAHAKSRCQDASTVKVGKIKSVLVVADGAGTCKFSHKGAKRLVSFLPTFLWKNYKILQTMPEDDLKRFLIEEIQKDLLAEAEKNKCTLTDLSSTLLAVQVVKDDFFAIHIGDGVIGEVKEDKTLIPLSSPENGEFVNQTFFTTSIDAVEHLQIYRGSAKSTFSFFAMTDGASDSFYNSQMQKFAPYLEKLFSKQMIEMTSDAFASSLSSDLAWLSKNRTTDDVSFAFFTLEKQEAPKETKKDLNKDDSCSRGPEEEQKKNRSEKKEKRIQKIISFLKEKNAPIALNEIAKACIGDISKKRGMKKAREFLNDLNIKGIVKFSGGQCYEIVKEGQND